jgi:2'-5' RNA ligase
MSARRLFFALWPDAPTAEQLRIATQALALTDGRIPADADLHVTLCFLGMVEGATATALCERVQSIQAAPFNLDFDTLEYWRRSRVLIATCSRSPPAVHVLAGELRARAQQVGLSPDERPFRPHLTLMRGLGTAPVRTRQPLRMPGALRLSADSFYLAQSQELESSTASQATRARYRRLMQWPLLAAPA